MNSLIENLIEAMKTIVEPISGKDIISLKMIRELRVEGQNIYFNIVLPGKNYASKEDLYQLIYQDLSSKFMDYQIHAHFVTQSPFSDTPNSLLPQINNFIAVCSGKGGVGKSTVSVNLALALHRLGFKTGLLDADLYGPSLPTMLGIKNQKPQVTDVDGKKLLVPIMVNGIPVISLGNIIEPEQAVVLRGPRLAAIIKQFFQETYWPDLDYLIIDLPPGTGDVQLTLVQTIPLTGVVMVTTPQEVAVIDAIKAANMFTMDQIKVPILGVVENMSWFVPEDDKSKKYYIFGKNGGTRLANFTHSLLLGQIPIVETLRERSDSGNVFDANSNDEYMNIYLDIAEKMDKKVQLRNLVLSPTRRVEQNG
ncbi:MAG: Mrp/NBP35 family ATP-binding protein [Saprospiraceae bacterium]|nr:Mrp/NBP35 family ATP-binding protein [Candidatus Vicinibacter affinis]MBP6173197.1 Mrp/NBP35 family ATP-binding protein [Saprospiraceae bacterium]MBK6572127.1 Mrp/NBP35 family ATP-binding protein [Candidatus Vicinibacter affinis]MBK6823870.1 Mrp/NBP35 family ATP-binding protein [Candidatus Vicinibacter affinis]MBK7693864.1 Mrp/NBP35 family ATP-binding protein [Candidatus Vicinibacter affinis]